MEYYDTIPRTSVKKLMSLGLEVQLSEERRILKVRVSDKELTKFKCDLIEEDYPKEFPDTFSILELNFDHPPKRKDSALSLEQLHNLKSAQRKSFNVHNRMRENYVIG
jgi:hypothetical protein